MAQDIRLIEDGFSASGSMNMYWETENTDDISKADDGARWHLERKGGSITFWIDEPPISAEDVAELQADMDAFNSQTEE